MKDDSGRKQAISRGQRNASVAVRLYETVRDLPIISPHGHTDPRWFAQNEAFPNPAALLIQPDHYIFRMLYSQGISLESLGIPQLDGVAQRRPARGLAHLREELLSCSAEPPPVSGWTTPSRISSASPKRLSADNADEYYESDLKETPDSRVSTARTLRKLQHRGPLHHRLPHSTPSSSTKPSGSRDGRAGTTDLPARLSDRRRYAGFLQNIEKLGEITGEDIGTWQGYLNALATAAPSSSPWGPPLPITGT